MFYSETLLQKSGPLARVWLSANLERKLSKTHILQSDLGESIEAIITPSQAPMALRLSGQLLLGVVRIYSRKARYLLDDCNEALVKIKMAFRSSGNNDLTTNLHAPTREALMLPDKITQYDSLELPPPPDAGWLLSQMEDPNATGAALGRKGRVSNRDINLQEDYSNSQFLDISDTLDEELALAPLDDIQLDLDFGMDIERPSKFNQTMELGRDAPLARSVEDDIFSVLDDARGGKEPLDMGREPSLALDIGDDTVRIADDEGDIHMRDDDFQFNIGEDPSVVPAGTSMAQLGRGRISESPLSDIDEDFAKEVEEEYTRHQQTDFYEPEEEQESVAVRRPAARVKKPKLILPDEETMLSSAHIKEQQAHHDNILRSQAFVPRDSHFASLIELQKTGYFSGSILHGKRTSAWSPALRGLLSMSAIRVPVEMKRKREHVESETEAENVKSPRLEFGEEEEFGMSIAPVAEETAIVEETVVELAPEEQNLDDVSLEREEISMGGPAFDETVAPLVHPAESGPVSIGTQHAVHILREIFGPDAEHDAEKRKESAVVFQDLLPEGRTSKADATKMFFECLVLATKDAIKVEQGPELGAAIKIRGKRGLWGTWAENEAGGEMAAQMGAEVEPVSAATPGPTATSFQPEVTPAVSVEA
ncbi:sister chromatid cohesion protein 1 [Ceratocystis pirilliformis]|uniref:Sister chromatid cohesion protein 1 n=1 Tax=Ceratocystis pirilliformis TaxID=259994 RepID=A0ABR3Z7Y9_9PEZI